VVIRSFYAEEKTLGGIIILDTAQEKPMEGDVVAVGREPAMSRARSSTSR
jgi:chaperonin GroES